MAQLAGLSWWQAGSLKLQGALRQLLMPFRTLPSNQDLQRAAKQQGFVEPAAEEALQSRGGVLVGWLWQALGVRRL